VLALYQETGAYLEGHFLLASGRHAPKFLQSTTVMQYPKHAEAFGQGIARMFEKPDFVLGPAMGGVVLAHETAKALGCRALFAEKDGQGSMKLREAFKITAGENFIAVEDVVTTGGSLLKAIKAAEALGATCVGIGCIINRGMANFTVPFKTLLTLEFLSYPADECPLCKQGLRLEEV
jgi:orotate phosphoribosyltransferase